jgi:hypothetical protein
MKRVLFLIIAMLAIARITGQDAIIYKLPDGMAPVIDGYTDDLWYIFQEFNIDKPDIYGQPTIDKAIWQAVWNDTALFIIVSVEEDSYCPHWCQPEQADWWSDKPEIYLDVNEVLKDGMGPTLEFSGHYQIAPAFTEGEDHYYRNDTTWQGWEYSYAYRVDGADYVFEYDIPWSTLKDKNDIVFDPGSGRSIGFDVYVNDRDQGESIRNRVVWMNDMKGPTSDEAWNNMDDCGVVAFIEARINDSIVCDTGKMSYTSFDVPVDSITDYIWDTDGGEILSSAENFAVIKWNTTGEKNISLAITKTGGAKDTFKTRILVYHEFSVSLVEDFTVCPNTEFTLAPSTIVNGIRPFEYFWNSISGDSVFEGSIIDTSNIILIIKDNAGCTATDNINVNVSTGSFTDQICMVTVDAGTGKNKILWQKTGGKLTVQYQVLKETTVTGQYSVIGTIPFNNESVFTDTASEPSKHSDSYRITTIDSCGNTSYQSWTHQTIHLMLSPGLPGKFNLSWSPYIGFNYNTYYIYKGSTPESLELIDSIAASKTQYTDNESGIAYYQVAVRREEPCDISILKSSGNIYSEAGSNIESTVTSNTGNEIIPETSFMILPNPFIDELVIEYTLQEPSDVIIEIYSLLGVKVYEFRTNHILPGTFRHIVSEESLHNAGNLLIMRLELDKKVNFRKLLKQ